MYRSEVLSTNIFIKNCHTELHACKSYGNCCILARARLLRDRQCQRQHRPCTLTGCAAGVEDIHGLMGFSKKAPKPHLQAAYFKALTRIFFVSGAYLFHAYAWQKLYILTKNQKKLPVS